MEMHCFTPAEGLAQNIPQLRVWMIRLLRKHHEQDSNASSGINVFLPHLHPVFCLSAWRHHASMFLAFSHLQICRCASHFYFSLSYLLLHRQQQVTPGLFLTGIKIRGLVKLPPFSLNWSTRVCGYFQIPGLNLKVLLTLKEKSHELSNLYKNTGLIFPRDVKLWVCKLLWETANMKGALGPDGSAPEVFTGSLASGVSLGAWQVNSQGLLSTVLNSKV